MINASKPPPSPVSLGVGAGVGAWTGKGDGGCNASQNYVCCDQLSMFRKGSGGAGEAS